MTSREYYLVYRPRSGEGKHRKKATTKNSAAQQQTSAWAAQTSSLWSDWVAVDAARMVYVRQRILCDDDVADFQQTDWDQLAYVPSMGWVHRQYRDKLGMMWPSSREYGEPTHEVNYTLPASPEHEPQSLTKAASAISGPKSTSTPYVTMKLKDLRKAETQDNVFSEAQPVSTANSASGSSRQSDSRRGKSRASSASGSSSRSHGSHKSQSKKERHERNSVTREEPSSGSKRRTGHHSM